MVFLERNVKRGARAKLSLKATANIHACVCVRERERECHSTTHTLLSSSHLRRAEVLRQMCEEHPQENVSILLPEYNSGRSLIPNDPDHTRQQDPIQHRSDRLPRHPCVVCCVPADSVCSRHFKMRVREREKRDTRDIGVYWYLLIRLGEGRQRCVNARNLHPGRFDQLINVRPVAVRGTRRPAPRPGCAGCAGGIDGSACQHALAGRPVGVRRHRHSGVRELGRELEKKKAYALWKTKNYAPLRRTAVRPGVPSKQALAASCVT